MPYMLVLISKRLDCNTKKLTAKEHFIHSSYVLIEVTHSMHKRAAVRCKLKAELLR